MSLILIFHHLAYFLELFLLCIQYILDEMAVSIILVLLANGNIIIINQLWYIDIFILLRTISIFNYISILVRILSFFFYQIFYIEFVSFSPSFSSLWLLNDWNRDLFYGFYLEVDFLVLLIIIMIFLRQIFLNILDFWLFSLRQTLLLNGRICWLDLGLSIIDRLSLAILSWSYLTYFRTSFRLLITI